MKFVSIFALGLGAAVISLGACGDDTEDSSTDTATDTVGVDCTALYTANGAYAASAGSTSGVCAAAAGGQCNGVSSTADGQTPVFLECPSGQACSLISNTCVASDLTCSNASDVDGGSDPFKTQQSCSGTTLIAGCHANNTPYIVPCAEIGATGCAIPTDATDVTAAGQIYGFCTAVADQSCMGDYTTKGMDIRCDEGLTCTSGKCSSGG